MSGKRKLLSAVLALGVVAAVFVLAQVDSATKSIQFDLRTIGESIYEAHSNSGKWPMQIEDLEGTAYLRMPHRRALLEQGTFVIVWHKDLDPTPAPNRNRLLVYDNGSLLARLGMIWVCRGDLRIERMGVKQVAMLRAQHQQMDNQPK